MPAWDTTVIVMVYWFTDHWNFDGYATKLVSLKTKVALPAVLGIGLAVLGIGVLATLGIALVSQKK
ncbi:unnamed protein product [marine sediment metagenome]|uniref:Uncharacterized protein n=2 Tax=marine sediment metagenome TaxID=412755 RepID=X1VA50_9ZZZZ